MHVVGAGVPGGDIAAWCALHGLEVTLQDESAPRIAPAIARAAALFRAELEQPHQVQAALDRLMPDLHAVGIGRADLVIEAGGDGAAVRPALYRELESRMRPDALLATATADLPLDTLGAALLRPGRLVGLHFFTPVAQVRLVEVVSAPATDAGVSARAAAFVRGIDRLPLPVRSRPGLLVDRVLLPYLLEAVTAVGEGIRPELVDRAALEFGMATGPLEFADAMGLDACLALADLRYGQQRALVPERLLRMVEAGHLGRASGRGFYSYQNGAPLKGALDSAAAPPSDLGERLILRLLNEVVACRRERLVADDDDLDAGLLFGAGFAPFRGGPLHYIRARGVANLKEQLQGLAHAHGERFAPDPGWMEL